MRLTICVHSVAEKLAGSTPHATTSERFAGVGTHSATPDQLLLALFSLATRDSFPINQKHQSPLRAHPTLCLCAGIAGQQGIDGFNRFADIGGEDFQSHDCVVPGVELDLRRVATA